MTGSILALAMALSLAGVPSPTVASLQPDTKASAPAQTVNVNTATAAQFEALPGIGPSMARKIVGFREKNGPFKKLEDLMNVQGIGEKSFLKLRPYLSLGGTADAKAGTR